MSAGREDLAEIAREARTILAREVRRGRRTVVLGGGDAEVVGPRREPEGALEAAQPGSPRTEPPGRRQQRPEVARRGPTTLATPMALPGFEGLVPAQPAPGGTTGLPEDLSELAEVVAECRKCGLCETRTQTVFADGSTTARLVFVGEAPGRDEDLKGLPFVGRAGQLLDKMIAAIDLRREEVYICNVLKCRPPENRMPLPEEVDRCRPYLEQQLKLVRPDLICALGLSAAQSLLQTKASMASMRGRTFEYRGIPLIPTYHPAALLRNPSLKREAWEDMQRVRDTLMARKGT